MLKQDFDKIVNLPTYFDDDRELIYAAQILPGSYIFFPDKHYPQMVVNMRNDGKRIIFKVLDDGWKYALKPNDRIHWYNHYLWDDGKMFDLKGFITNKIAVAV